MLKRYLIKPAAHAMRNCKLGCMCAYFSPVLRIRRLTSGDEQTYLQAHALLAHVEMYC